MGFKIAYKKPIDWKAVCNSLSLLAAFPTSFERMLATLAVVPLILYPTTLTCFLKAASCTVSIPDKILTDLTSVCCIPTNCGTVADIEAVWWFEVGLCNVRVHDALQPEKARQSLVSLLGVTQSPVSNDSWGKARNREAKSGKTRLTEGTKNK